MRICLVKNVQLYRKARGPQFLRAQKVRSTTRTKTTMEGNDRDLIDRAEREDRERRDLRWMTGEMEVGSHS